MAEKIVAVVPGRMGSGRLPGKMLLPLGGKPLLGHILDRLTCCPLLDQVVFATSTRPENDALQHYCAARGTAVFRGDEDDVLGRLRQALDAHQATLGVLVFGDQPLVDPEIIEKMVQFFLERRTACDWVGNTRMTTFPPGTEAEVFAMTSLRDADAQTRDPRIREHATLFLRNHPERYRLFNVVAPPELAHPNLYIEVDVAEDVTLVETILAHFAPRDIFGLREILDFMKSRPQLQEINGRVHRRWKEFRSEIRENVFVLT
ncbi:MAG: NTP transferase domain-containing protein [Magnetococcus sp. DMHC-1]